MFTSYGKRESIAPVVLSDSHYQSLILANSAYLVQQERIGKANKMINYEFVSASYLQSSKSPLSHLLLPLFCLLVTTCTIGSPCWLPGG